MKDFTNFCGINISGVNDDAGDTGGEYEDAGEYDGAGDTVGE